MVQPVCSVLIFATHAFECLLSYDAKCAMKLESSEIGAIKFLYTKSKQKSLQICIRLGVGIQQAIKGLYDPVRLAGQGDAIVVNLLLLFKDSYEKHFQRSG